jgi:2-polyprenyl-3-methyl-5-hydroxy-6-metoxy-1,4-benzoquinol methylase
LSKYWQLAEDYIKNLHDTKIRGSNINKEIKIIHSNRASRIQKILKFFFDKTKNKTMLDFGCGIGDVSFGLGRYGYKITAVDTENRAIKIAKIGNMEFGCKINFQKISGSISYKNKFDVIIFNHVIEHVANPSKTLRELHAALKPGGILYLTTANKLYPIDPHTGLLFAPWMDKKLFTWPRLKEILQGSGFQVKNYTPYIIKNLAQLYKDSEQHSAIKFAIYKTAAKILRSEFLINTFTEVFTVVGKKL